MSESKCWTCDRVLEDAEIALCQRKWCTGQTALKKSRDIRPPQPNPSEKPELWDSWVSGVAVPGQDGIYRLFVGADGNFHIMSAL